MLWRAAYLVGDGLTGAAGVGGVLGVRGSSGVFPGGVHEPRSFVAGADAPCGVRVAARGQRRSVHGVVRGTLVRRLRPPLT